MDGCGYCGADALLHTRDELAHHHHLLVELGPLPVDDRRQFRHSEILARYGLTRP